MTARQSDIAAFEWAHLQRIFAHVFAARGLRPECAQLWQSVLFPIFHRLLCDLAVAGPTIDSEGKNTPSLALPLCDQVQVKALPAPVDGSGALAAYYPCVAITAHVAHRQMRSAMDRPTVLLLDFDVSSASTDATQLACLADLIPDNAHKDAMLLAQIARLQPSLIVCTHRLERSVLRQLTGETSVLMHVPRTDIDRLARMGRGSVCASVRMLCDLTLDQLAEFSRFEVRTYNRLSQRPCMHIALFHTHIHTDIAVASAPGTLAVKQTQLGGALLFYQTGAELSLIHI